METSSEIVKEALELLAAVLEVADVVCRFTTSNNRLCSLVAKARRVVQAALVLYKEFVAAGDMET
ncbi:hypothetical protein [Ignicoccus hospitalis]|uniref:hypothetical protein n=1 Tax=Ignicoccus hospitalis TaxID=160233 RepID=UPI001650161F|nr:hypothetical protein [Ignicoccus hospitalis]HIH90962.1 hypothetical protein [Desulfurococcaceae archaeon]